MNVSMIFGKIPFMLFIFFLEDIFIFTHIITAAAAKSLQSCPTLSDPMQPTRLLRPWDSPGWYPINSIVAWHTKRWYG